MNAQVTLVALVVPLTLGWHQTFILDTNLWQTCDFFQLLVVTSGTYLIRRAVFLPVANVS